MLEIVDTIKWAVVVAVCVIAAFGFFRSPITALINRIRRAGFGNRTIDFSPTAAEQQKTLEPPAVQQTGVPLSAVMPPPVEIYTEIENEITTAIKTANYPPEVEAAWLIRALATTRIWRSHEVVYRIILGSQIDLILAANAAPINMARAQQFFDGAKAAFPAMYSNFGFDAWLHYPTASGLIKTEQQGNELVLRTTLLGQDFLHYLVNNNMTSPKAG